MPDDEPTPKISYFESYTQYEPWPAKWSATAYECKKCGSFVYYDPDADGFKGCVGCGEPDDTPIKALMEHAKKEADAAWPAIAEAVKELDREDGSDV
jgi:predicted  nucleic acid-binding Zn-ribbon protein